MLNSVLCRLIGHRWRYSIGEDVTGNVKTIVTLKRCEHCPTPIKIVSRKQVAA